MTLDVIPRQSQSPYRVHGPSEVCGFEVVEMIVGQVQLVEGDVAERVCVKCILGL